MRTVNVTTSDTPCGFDVYVAGTDKRIGHVCEAPKGCEIVYNAQDAEGRVISVENDKPYDAIDDIVTDVCGASRGRIEWDASY